MPRVGEIVGSVAGPQGATGPTGPQGPKGDTGPSAGAQTLQRLVRTSGSITLTASTTTMKEASSALRITIPAVAGDVLTIGLSALVAAGTTGEAALDSATIVSGVITNQVSAGSRGIGHGYTSGLMGLTGTLTYVVQSADVVSGNVTLTVTYINSGNTGTLYATTTYALTYWAMNWGQ